MQIFQNSNKYSCGIRIPFTKLLGVNFGEENNSIIENFVMSTKKTYSKHVDFFIHENNKIIELDVDNEVLANYFMVKYRIDNQSFANPNVFIDAVIYEILKPEFVEAVKNYVQKIYYEKCDDIDSSLHNEQGKLSMSLVFTNQHAIILYQVASIFRFISPLLTHFMYVYSDMISRQDASKLYDESDTNGIHLIDQKTALTIGKKLFNNTEFLLMAVKNVINIVTSTDEDMFIYTKLSKCIMSLISKTSFSDREMWSKLTMNSTSKYDMCNVIMAKILIDILPKATFDKSIVKFIITTVETHINWGIRQKFSIHYNMISPISEDSDFSDADRFEINNVKTNEFKKIISNKFIDDTINILFSRKNFVIDPAEYDFYIKNNNPIHGLQDSTVRNFFAAPFGGWNNLDSLNIYQYTKLLIYLIHYLETNDNFKILPSILTGRVLNLNEKRLLPKPIEKKIKESARYQNIMKKYSYTGDVIENHSIIEQSILFILNSNIVYNKYNCSKNGEIIDTDVMEVCDEYLKFLELL